MDLSDSNDYACSPLKPNNTESIPGWEGIPETGVFNALIATVSLIFLGLIRISYFKSKPYQNDWNISWLQFIYSDRNVELLHSGNHINRLHPSAYLPACLQEYTDRITNKLPERMGRSSLYVINSLSGQTKKTHQAIIDNVGRSRHWLLDYLLIRDRDIYEHRGNDAFQYLLFQRYIIYFMTALTAICMIILIPVNIYGKDSGQRYFEMTTISNINESSNIFWIHAIISIVVVILGLLMMKNFSDLIFTPTIESDERTILIQNVPEGKRNARQLKAFIEKKFTGVEVTQVWFTYDVEALTRLKKHLDTIDAALHYTEKYTQENGHRLRVSPQFCGRFSSVCASVDAATYYTQQKEEYEALRDTEVSRLLTDPKHAVFLQLKNDLMAQRILDHFSNSQNERVLKSFFKYIQGCFAPASSRSITVGDSFYFHSWIIKAAPFPDDIEWKDIVMDTNRSGICALLLNLTVLLIFVFLTTPLMAANYLEEYIGISFQQSNNSNATFNDFWIGSTKVQLAKYSSVLFFNTISSLLPNLIMVIALHTPRNTKSEKNYHAMLYVYLFLILMVLIFPTIGLNSGRLLLEKLVKSHDQDYGVPKNLYQCLFQPGASAWFVQIVISYIFINNSMELLRLPELMFYLLNCLIYPRTEAEYTRARLETNLDFNYGSSYPRFLLIFTIVTTYSIACPIIAPFGLAYMMLKHLVDRYSLYYMYSTPVISPKIHQTAITFVLTSFFFLLFQLTAFLNTRIDFSFSFKPPNLCAVACLLYLTLFICACCNFSSLYQESNSENRFQLASTLSRRRNSIRRSRKTPRSGTGTTSRRGA